MTTLEGFAGHNLVVHDGIARLVEDVVPTAPAADRDRFEHLYRSYYRAVLGYCLRRTSLHDAHDAVAEVFTFAWRRIDSVPEGDGARAWLFAVAYRVIGHRWRRIGRDRKLYGKLRSASEVSNPGPERQVVRSSEHEQALRAVAGLPRRDREILLLRVWEELSYREIALVLGIEVDTAKQRFHRAKQRIAVEYERLNRQRPGPGTVVRGGER